MQDTIDALYEELAYLDDIASVLAMEYLAVEELRSSIKREIKEAESLGSRWG